MEGEFSWLCVDSVSQWCVCGKRLEPRSRHGAHGGCREKNFPHNFPTVCRKQTIGERAKVGEQEFSGLNFGAGDGTRTRNFQLGNVIRATFIFNTYTHLQKCLGKTCVHTAHDVPSVATLARHCGTFAGQTPSLQGSSSTRSFNHTLSPHFQILA